MATLCERRSGEVGLRGGRDWSCELWVVGCGLWKAVLSCEVCIGVVSCGLWKAVLSCEMCI